MDAHVGLDARLLIHAKRRFGTIAYLAAYDVHHARVLAGVTIGVINA